MNQSQIMQLESHCQDMAISRRISLSLLLDTVVINEAPAETLTEIKEHVQDYAHHLELLLGLVRLAQDKLA